MEYRRAACIRSGRKMNCKVAGGVAGRGLHDRTIRALVEREIFQNYRDQAGPAVRLRQPALAGPTNFEAMTVKNPSLAPKSRNVEPETRYFWISMTRSGSYCPAARLEPKFDVGSTPVEFSE
jgi:hypothetical protein